MWFLNPFAETIIHILDIFAIGAATFFFSYGLCTFFEVSTLIIATICTIYIIIRLYFGIKHFYFSWQSEKKVSLTTIAPELCAQYLYRTVPMAKPKMSSHNLNIALCKLCQDLQLLPQSRHIATSFVFIVIGGVLLAAILWCFGVFTIMGIKPPATIALIVSIVLIPCSAIMIINGFLSLFACGRKLIFNFVKFCKRYGLKFCFFMIDILYIQVIYLFFKHLIPSKVSCDEGEFYKIYYNKADIWDMFMNHSSRCTPCYSTPIFSQCKEICKNTGDELVLQVDPSLYFVHDVLEVNGGTLIYALLFIVFGTPIFTYLLVKKFKSFLIQINGYGKTPEEKWKNIIHRMKGNGLFCFAPFTLHNVYWQTLLLVYKLIMVVFTLIGSNFTHYYIFVIPVVYLFMFVFTIIRRPYIHTANIVIDCVFYFLNLLYSLAPILAYFGIQIPNSAFIVFTVAFFLFFAACFVISISTIYVTPINIKDEDITSMPIFNDDELDRREKLKNEIRNKQKAKKSPQAKKKITARRDEPLSPRMRLIREKSRVIDYSIDYDSYGSEYDYYDGNEEEEESNSRKRKRNSKKNKIQDDDNLHLEDIPKTRYNSDDVFKTRTKATPVYIQQKQEDSESSSVEDISDFNPDEDESDHTKNPKYKKVVDPEMNPALASISSNEQFDTDNSIQPPFADEYLASIQSDPDSDDLLMVSYTTKRNRSVRRSKYTIQYNGETDADDERPEGAKKYKPHIPNVPKDPKRPKKEMRKQEEVDLIPIKEKEDPKPTRPRRTRKPIIKEETHEKVKKPNASEKIKTTNEAQPLIVESPNKDTKPKRPTRNPNKKDQTQPEEEIENKMSKRPRRGRNNNDNQNEEQVPKIQNGKKPLPPPKPKKQSLSARENPRNTKRSDHRTPIEDLNEEEPNDQKKKNSEIPIRKVRTNNPFLIDMKKIQEDDVQLEEDLITLCVKDIAPISAEVQEDDDKQFRVNRIMFAQRMDQMYTLLDMVVDGSTLQIFSKGLNFIILVATFAFGWYVGLLTANTDTPQLDCSLS